MAKAKKYSEVPSTLVSVVTTNSNDDAQRNKIKEWVQNSYGYWADNIYERAFLNWGLLDSKLQHEYESQLFPFYQLCPYQDINSQLLIYSLIQPLVKQAFFGKNLLEIGCGNGIGTRLCTELLQTNLSVGLDLVDGFIRNATKNFHKPGQLNYVQGDSEILPFPDNSFDIVTNLESSHLYPCLTKYYQEVFRVLKPEGYFCYADIYFPEKRQDERIEHFAAHHPNVTIKISKDITKPVRLSIYDRLITNEERFYAHAKDILKTGEFFTELCHLARAMGIQFLPQWWVRFSHPELKPLAKEVRSIKHIHKRKFFYYLLQKS